MRRKIAIRIALVLFRGDIYDKTGFRHSTNFVAEVGTLKYHILCLLFGKRALPPTSGKTLQFYRRTV